MIWAHGVNSFMAWLTRLRRGVQEKRVSKACSGWLVERFTKPAVHGDHQALRHRIDQAA